MGKNTDDMWVLGYISGEIPNFTNVVSHRSWPFNRCTAPVLKSIVSPITWVQISTKISLSPIFSSLSLIINCHRNGTIIGHKDCRLPTQVGWDWLTQHDSTIKMKFSVIKRRCSEWLASFVFSLRSTESLLEFLETKESAARTESGNRNVWKNEDLDLSPPCDWTWTWRDYAAFWWSYGMRTSQSYLTPDSCGCIMHVVDFNLETDFIVM